MSLPIIQGLPDGTCNFLTGAAGGTPVDADLWEGDASAAFSKSATAALTAWRDRGLDGTVDLGGHEMPASSTDASRVENGRCRI